MTPLQHVAKTILHLPVDDLRLLSTTILSSGHVSNEPDEHGMCLALLYAAIQIKRTG